MCRCGLSHFGVAATMVNRNWKTASGYDCCAWGTYFDGSSDDIKRGAELVGISDSSTFVMAFNVAANGPVNLKSFCTISNNGATPGLTIGWDSSHRLVVTVTPGAASPVFSFRSNLSFLPSFPLSYMNVLIAVNTNFSAGNKIGQLYINDTLDSVVVSDSGVAFNIDFTQPRFTYCTDQSQSSSARPPIATSFFYFHAGVFQDFSVAANRRLYFTPDSTPVCELFTSNNGGWASGGQPHIYLRDSYATYQTNYGTGGTLTVTGALTGEMSPCDIPPSEVIGPPEGEGEPKEE